MNDRRDTPTDGSIEPGSPATGPTPAGSDSSPAASAPTSSDAPQPPQAPPGPPQPPTQAPAARTPEGSTSSYAAPTSSYAPPVANQAPSAFAPPTASRPTPTAPPAGAAGQQTYPFGPNPYQRPAQPGQYAPGQQGPGQYGTGQQTATHPGAGGSGNGSVAATGPHAQGAAGKPAKRSAPIGLIAALAIGALVGGVSGAGVTAIALNANQAGQAPSSASTPANITVNDGADATVITAVAAAAGPSVVTISVADSSGSGGTGSGVILSEDGYVLTNTHVVTLDGASAEPTVTVQTADGRLFKADIVGTDPISDLAVIKIQDGADFQPAEFADSDDLNVGDTAVAIGAPLGLANTVTNGIVSSLNRSITVASSAAPQTPGEAPDPNDDNGGDGPFDFWQFGTPDQQQQPTQASSTIALSVIQTDAAINPGNSGGALLDSEGKVIGINVAIASAGSGDSSSSSGSIGVGFAIPSNLAQRISQEIIETGTGSHGLLGASVDDVTDPDATVVGAAIQEVTPGGAAQAAGLQAGDIVTKVGDIPITGRTDLTAQIRALAAGADTTLTYVRGGDVGTVDVTLGSLE